MWLCFAEINRKAYGNFGRAGKPILRGLAPQALAISVFSSM